MPEAKTGASGEAKVEKAKAPKVNQYAQTEEQFKEAHGGRSPEEVEPPSPEYSEDHQEAKKKARWG